MRGDNFTEVHLTADNLDLYFIRKSILKVLTDEKKYLSGKLLDAGCGKMPYRKFILDNTAVEKYVGLDIETALVYQENVIPDYTWNGITMPFESSTFDCAFATEVLEHCFEPGIILKEIYRVLKPGGTFLFTVPFIWNLHEVPNDAFRYTPFAMEKKLGEAGFKEKRICAYGGWNSSMAQMLGLWVRRSQMRDSRKNLLSFLLKPVIRMLINRDSHIFGHSNFNEGMMISGFYGICKK
jgi:SAM-dependent methyltransferase